MSKKVSDTEMERCGERFCLLLPQNKPSKKELVMIRRAFWTIVLAPPLVAGSQGNAEEVWLSLVDLYDVTPMFMEKVPQPDIWNLMSILSCK